MTQKTHTRAGQEPFPGSASKTEDKGGWRLGNLGTGCEVTGLDGTESSFKENRIENMYSIDPKLENWDVF